MNVVVVLLHLVLAAAAEPRLSWQGEAERQTDARAAPPASWFEQRVDHFNDADQRTFWQRFYTNDTFEDRSKPPLVFLMLGGEAGVNPAWLRVGAVIDYAQQFGALFILLEHRYYGLSRPTSDMSVPNLAYLSSEQALADVAEFISSVNSARLGAGARWVVFGGSYAGSLAAWARLKYPHLVLGAVSSSAAIHATLDFDKFLENAVASLTEQTGSAACATQIRIAHKQIASLIKSPNHRHLVEEKFKTCKSFSNATKNDLSNFYRSLAYTIGSVVQYNKDGSISGVNSSDNIDIDTICDIMTRTGTQFAYERLANISNIFLKKLNESCFMFDYMKGITKLKTTKPNNMRQWLYQLCSELGFHETSSRVAAFFGNDFTVDFAVQECKDAFGVRFDKEFILEATRRTNMKYGGLDIAVTNVVFVQGSVDPWRSVGLLRKSPHHDDTVGVIVINGTAHCADLYPPRATDSSELRAARDQIEGYVASWLAQPYSAVTSN